MLFLFIRLGYVFTIDGLRGCTDDNTLYTSGCLRQWRIGQPERLQVVKNSLLPFLISAGHVGSIRMPTGTPQAFCGVCRLSRTFVNCLNIFSSSERSAGRKQRQIVQRQNKGSSHFYFISRFACDVWLGNSRRAFVTICFFIPADRCESSSDGPFRDEKIARNQRSTHLRIFNIPQIVVYLASLYRRVDNQLTITLEGQLRVS